jgi:hypothetical protein
MSKKTLLLAVAAALAAGASSYGATASSGPTPYASGHQVISSGPGVYAQTSDEYAGSWNWRQTSAGWDYYWYVFTSGGTLAGNGHIAGGNGSWSGTPNIYYFKEYNNEPSGSGRINVLDVTYCC